MQNSPRSLWRTIEAARLLLIQELRGLPLIIRLLFPLLFFVRVGAQWVKVRRAGRGVRVSPLHDVRGERRNRDPLCVWCRIYLDRHVICCGGLFAVVVVMVVIILIVVVTVVVIAMTGMVMVEVVFFIIVIGDAKVMVVLVG